MAQALRKRVHGDHEKSEFDIIHVEHLRGVRYGLEINSNALGISSFNRSFGIASIRSAIFSASLLNIAEVKFTAG